MKSHKLLWNCRIVLQSPFNSAPCFISWTILHKREKSSLRSAALSKTQQLLVTWRYWAGTSWLLDPSIFAPPTYWCGSHTQVGWTWKYFSVRKSPLWMDLNWKEETGLYGISLYTLANLIYRCRVADRVPVGRQKC